MSVEKVKNYFKPYHMEDRIIEKEESSATVEKAAHALGCEPGRIAKTLSFGEDDEEVILVVTAGDRKIDNKKFKSTFGIKPRMLKADEVESRVGYPVGGVCPFGVNKGVRVYLDYSMKRFENVYPAAGSLNSMINLSLEELYKYGKAKGWVDVCKE